MIASMPTRITHPMGTSNQMKDMLIERLDTNEEINEDEVMLASPRKEKLTETHSETKID